MKHPVRFAFYCLFATAGFGCLLFIQEDISMMFFAMLMGLAGFFRPNPNLNKSLTKKDLAIALGILLAIIIFISLLKSLPPKFEENFDYLVHSPLLLIPVWLLGIFISLPYFKAGKESARGSCA